MNVEAMVIKHSLKPRGVIQAGSHHGEEIPLWESLRVKHVHFEPIHDNFTTLRDKYPSANVWCVALGNKHNEFVRMVTEKVNGGQSCSCLTPKTHLDLLPWITFDGTEDVMMVSLDGLGLDWSDYNFMYVDAQGYELEIFKGARETLKGIDFIFTEVNRAEVFEGCAQIGELDAYLADQGFKRVETEWHGGDFGDALYVRA